MAFANLNGLTVHYELIGNPRAKTLIVFSNALGTDFRIWLPVFDELPDDMAFLLYDSRGHGLTSDTGTPFTIDTLADDAIALVEHLRLRQPILCGISVGGLVMQAVAVKRPDLAKKLIVCNSAAKLGNVETWNGRIDAIKNGGLAAVSQATTERWFTPDFRSARPADVSGYRLMVERQDAASHIRTAEAIRDADYRGQVKNLTLPSLFLAGDQDASVAMQAVEDTADLVEGSAYEMIENCGHMTPVEQPEQLAALITDFVRG